MYHRRQGHELPAARPARAVVGGRGRAPPRRVYTSVVSACLLVVTVALGCAAPQKSGSVAGAEMITLQELDQLNRGFADRFVLLVATACEDVQRDNPSAAQRRKAHELKLYCATSAFDIASNADPYTSLLDLTLAVTLVSQVWIDEDHAEEVFGPERARPVIAALRRARVEVWELAARALKPEHLDTLDHLIWEWRHDNPEVEHVEFVRFDTFSAGRGKSQIADVRTGGGFLAPVNEAKRAVDEARLLAERAFYMGKRAPLTLSWQAEAATNELLANPEVNRAIADVSALNASADRLARLLDRLPKDVAAERVAILAAIDQRDRTLNATIANVRAAIADADRALGVLRSVLPESEKIAVELRATSNALTGTVKAVEAMAARYAPPAAPGPSPAANPPGDHAVATAAAPTSAPAPAGDGQLARGVIGPATTAPAPATRPVAAMAAPVAAATTATTAPVVEPPKGFDIKGYADAATELGRAAREMRLFVESTEGLMESEAWTYRLREINAAADERMNVAAARSQTLVTDVFRRVYVAIATIFVLVLLLRILSRHIKSRRGPPRNRPGTAALLLVYLSTAVGINARAADATPPASRPTTGPLTRPAAAYPKARTLGSAYPEYVADRQAVSGTLNCVGSTTLTAVMYRWADEFQLHYPGVTVNISNAGSETAPAALIAGEAQLAPMSRPMSDAEREAFRRKVGRPPVEMKVAVDALAVFVEKNNPILQRGLSFRELDGVFSRDRLRGGPPVRMWGDLGLTGEWADRRITPYEWGRGRTPSVIFREAVLTGGEFNASVHAERTSSSLVQAVAADPGGICCDFFCFQSKRARAIPIRTDDGQFLLPDEASCQQGRYPLARFHYIYFDHRPGKPVAPTTAAFLSFILSRQGQQIVIDNGSYPLAAEMAAEQREFLRN